MGDGVLLGGPSTALKGLQPVDNQHQENGVEQGAAEEIHDILTPVPLVPSLKGVSVTVSGDSAAEEVSE